MNRRRLSLLAALLASLCVPGRVESSLQGRADSSLQLLIDFEDPENPARDATGNYATSSVALGTAAADDPKRGAHSGDFNGVDTSITIDTPLQWPAEVTFAVWFQEDAVAAQESSAMIFNFYQTPTVPHDRIQLLKSNNENRYYFNMHQTSPKAGSKSWYFDTQPGVWNFFCVSIQADKTWTLFHNGNLQVLSNQLAMDTSLTYTASKVGMHAGFFANAHFHGKIDELAIFNRALSAAEISELYANGLTPPGPRAGFQYKQRVTKVTTTMSMPLTVEEFTVDAQREYKETVAAVVGVHADQVTIVSVTAQ